MDELHTYRPFTNSGGHSFDGAMPHVAYGEYTGNVGLEQKRIPFEWPPLRPLPASHQVGARQYKAAFIALNDIREPVGSRQRSDEDEHRTGRHPFDLIRVGAQKRNLFQMGFTMNFSHARVSPDLDVGRLLDLINQVL